MIQLENLFPIVDLFDFSCDCNDGRSVNVGSPRASKLLFSSRRWSMNYREISSYPKNKKKTKRRENIRTITCVPTYRGLTKADGTARRTENNTNAAQQYGRAEGARCRVTQSGRRAEYDINVLGRRFAALINGRVLPHVSDKGPDLNKINASSAKKKRGGEEENEWILKGRRARRTRPPRPVASLIKIYRITAAFHRRRNRAVFSFSLSLSPVARGSVPS